jgi:hypothetical protein
MFGAVLFMIGTACIAVNFTYFAHEALLLVGIILAGGGVAFSRLFREF